MSDPKATLFVEAVPDGVDVSPRSVVVPLDHRIVIGRVRDCDVYVRNALRAPGWGGRRNSTFEWGPDGWVVSHLQHGGTIYLNGASLQHQGLLADDDLIELGQGLRLRFRCSLTREELDAYRAIRDAYPEPLSLLSLVRVGPPDAIQDQLKRFEEIWDRLERRVPLSSVLSWGTPEDASVEADRRLEKQPELEAELLLVGPDRRVVIRETTTIGRDPRHSEITVPDKTLSRCHARFVVDLGELSVEDNASASGTYVNWVRAASRRLLKPGDELRMGQVVVRVLRIER